MVIMKEFDYICQWIYLIRTPMLDLKSRRDLQWNVSLMYFRKFLALLFYVLEIIHRESTNQSMDWPECQIKTIVYLCEKKALSMWKEGGNSLRRNHQYFYSSLLLNVIYEIFYNISKDWNVWLLYCNTLTNICKCHKSVSSLLSKVPLTLLSLF